MVVNQYNFLRWDDGTPVSFDTSLANGYFKDRNRCIGNPLAIIGESYSFYIGTSTGFTYTPGNLRVDILDSRGSVISTGIATMSGHLIPGSATNYNYYVILVFPTIPKGLYKYRIWDTSGSVVRFTSNLIEVISGTENTVLCKFRHDRYYYGVYYASVPSFYQQFRLRLNVIDEQPEDERELYTEQTTGKPRTYNSYQRWISTLETYYFDKDAHQAAYVMTSSDEFYINTLRYYVKTAYKITYDPQSKENKGQCELYDNAFNTANRC